LGSFLLLSNAFRSVNGNQFIKPVMEMRAPEIPLPQSLPPIDQLHSCPGYEISASDAPLAMNHARNSGAEPNRILIILMGSIGDVVRALPLLGRMRRAWPSAHITWAVEPKSAPIIDHHPWLDEKIVYNRARAPWSFPLFLNRIRLGRFDLVLDLQRHLKSGLVAWISGAPDRLGFSAANAKEFNHWFSSRQIPDQPNMRLKLMQYQSFGDVLGLPAAPIEFGLEPREEDLRRAAALIGDTSRPILGVILGSSWESRIYFARSTAQAIIELHRRHQVIPMLLGAPDERHLADGVRSQLGDLEVVDLAGRTGLKDLPALFRHCRAAFGPDCGPMHIAAAVGCPVVSLWGSTAPERSAPWGFAGLAIKAHIPCHPCYLRRCPIGRECMHRIEPGQVVAALEHALQMSAPSIP
jgi:ADP-heptose:LPS heptosyltransferase